MIIVNNIKLNIDLDYTHALQQAKKIIGVTDDKISEIFPHKISVDARGGRVMFVYSVAVALVDEKLEQALADKKANVTVKKTPVLKLIYGEARCKKPPVICGFGPAGMFAALLLARQGLKPIVIEQGQCIEERSKAIASFNDTAKLNVNSNIQFGEGGAGTFSDGKLTTRIGDDRCEFVLDTFVQHGADRQIKYNAKPHIGTDKLSVIIKNIRQEIISLGATVMFDTKLVDIIVNSGKVAKVVTDKGEIFTDNLILATGHSARDVFFMLRDKGADICGKPFSVGVRIEHLQSEIEKSLYHDLAGNPALPKGEYQLSQNIGTTGVYTFCMCPGGFVVAAASEENSVVVNGMSYHSRGGKNANSAVVVSVVPQQFDNDFAKAIAFQRKLEAAAFDAGKKTYRAPAQTLDCFLNGRQGMNIKRVEPTYPIGVEAADFSKIFPQQINTCLKDGILAMDRKLKGFAAQDSVITGVETRTSSPARIVRDDSFQSNLQGLYPCGEGAGYAGGIMSAAVDGVRVAQQIISQYKKIQ